ncbi:MAG: ABC transporter ATP-binding protein [Planctomycetales bacterium]|nr:ABC transporter ATP-binding protein [Planctomycetales bacterium]
MSVRLRDLRKHYAGQKALDGVTAEIPAGEVCGLVGPNGAGKSTLLKILATLVRPDAGSAEVAGADVRRQPDLVRARIGYLPESFGVYEGMDVEEYLEFFALAYRIPKGRRRALIGDLLSLVDLTSKRDADVASLSRGMRQRLGLARALVHDPPVLLLDEPTSGLDPRARLEFGALVRELRSLKKTVLVSSHLLEDLAEFCTTVIVLEKGKLVASGPLGGLAPTDGRRPVEVEVLERGKDAEALLAGEPAVRGLERDDGRLRFEVDGGPEEVARVHQKLAAAVPLLWFRERGDRLLEAFLRHTKGEVS